jgi:hypothetical protein
MPRLARAEILCESVAGGRNSPREEGHSRAVQALATVPDPDDAAGAFLRTAAPNRLL